MLNVDRPQNPFNRTDEPDWKASKTTPGGSHTVKHDKPKYWNSHRLPQTSDGSQSLPLDTNRHSQRREVALRGSSSRSSSQSSVVSMSSNVARKAAPPIPKKPALLSNRQHGQESSGEEQGKWSSSRPLSGGQMTPGGGGKTSLPPSLQRTEQQEAYGQQPVKSGGPPLPPRSTGARISVSNEIMDDENEGASVIPSLQPMRRQQ